MAAGDRKPWEPLRLRTPDTDAATTPEPSFLLRTWTGTGTGAAWTTFLLSIPDVELVTGWSSLECRAQLRCTVGKLEVGGGGGVQYAGGNGGSCL